MTTRFSVIFYCFLVACLSVTARAVAAQNSYFYVGPQFQVAATFTQDKSAIIAGEPLWVTLQITNIGKTPFETLEASYPEEFSANQHLVVEDSFGNICTSPPEAAASNWIVHEATLKHGESYVQRFLATEYWHNNLAGAYNISCPETIALRSLGKRHVESTTVSFVVDSNVIVKPYDSVVMGAVIDSLGEMALSDKGYLAGDAAESLSLIHDPRTIPWMDKIGREHNPETEALTVRGLRRFGTVQAAAALVPDMENAGAFPGTVLHSSLESMENSPDATPETVAQAVRAPLLTDLQSPLPSTRATAAAALGETHDPMAFQQLLNSLNDNDDAVRVAAAKALGRFGDAHAVSALMAAVHSTADENLVVASSASLVALGQPFDVRWLIPVVKTWSIANQTAPWDAMAMINQYGGSAAGPALASCLRFNEPDPDKLYNSTLIDQLDNAPGPTWPSKKMWLFDTSVPSPLAAVRNNESVLKMVSDWIVNSNKPRPEINIGLTAPLSALQAEQRADRLAHFHPVKRSKYKFLVMRHVHLVKPLSLHRRRHVEKLFHSHQHRVGRPRK